MSLPAAVDTAQRQARWVVVAFVGVFLFQRLAVPGLPVSMTVPLLLLWAGLAMYRGVLELDAKRTVVWLLATGVSGLLMVPQAALLHFPLISVNSWLLWMVTWLPMVFRFPDRTPQAYDTTLRGIAWAGAGLTGVSIIFVLSQMVGISYRDYFAELVPHNMQLGGFVITYPIAWDSPIHKSNAWLALEPSFLSFMLGVSMVSALMSRRHPLLVVWLGLGLLSTTAGSGIAIVGVYVIAALLRGRGRALMRYAVVAIPIALIGAITTLGDSIIDRLTEASDARSSTALRVIEPYVYLTPEWLSDAGRMLVGEDRVRPNEPWQMSA